MTAEYEEMLATTHNVMWSMSIQLISIWWRSESGGSGRQKKKLPTGKKCKVEKKEENTTPAPPLWIFPALLHPFLSLSLFFKTHTHTEGRTPPLYFSRPFLLRRSTCEPPHHSKEKKGSMWVLIGSCHSEDDIIKKQNINNMSSSSLSAFLHFNSSGCCL